MSSRRRWQRAGRVAWCTRHRWPRTAITPTIRSPFTEDVPPRGSPEHYYSEQKAACEAALAEITGSSALEVYVLRPCIVAGPKAPALAEAMPWNPWTAASAASEVIARLPFVPSALEWLHAGRTSVVMDTGKAKSQLGWVPKYTAAETLCALGETL